MNFMPGEISGGKLQLPIGEVDLDKLDVKAAATAR
jgi:hypothetical protein